MKESMEMDINTPVTNPNLLNAIQLMSEDKSYESHFIDELFKATFLCPGKLNKGDTVKVGENKLIAKEGMTIDLSSLEIMPNKNFLMAFTDWDELLRLKQDDQQQAFLFSFDDYKAVLTNNTCYEGVIINPFGASIAINKEDLIALRPEQNLVQKGESVMIGAPKDYPTDMVEKLKSYFHAARTVDAAYLLWMARGNETSYLLVLGSSLSPQKIFPVVGEICQPYLEGKPLDMIPMDSAFGKEAIKGQEPFYQKQESKIFSKKITRKKGR